MRLECNILALIGASIGIISIFLPWIYYYDMPGPPYPGSNLLYLSSRHIPGMPLPALIFILSSLLSLITPLSFIGQISSLVLFSAAYVSINSDTFEDTASLAYGVTVGIISILVLIISILLPFGKKMLEGRIRIPDRILTFHPEMPDE